MSGMQKRIEVWIEQRYWRVMRIAIWPLSVAFGVAVVFAQRADGGSLRVQITNDVFMTILAPVILAAGIPFIAGWIWLPVMLGGWAWRRTHRGRPAGTTAATTRTWEQALEESRLLREDETGLNWSQPTEQEARAMEAEGPIISFLKDGVPTLSIDLAKDPQPSTNSASADSPPDSSTSPEA
jgi:hypothetical protein